MVSDEKAKNGNQKEKGKLKNVSNFQGLFIIFERFLMEWGISPLGCGVKLVVDKVEFLFLPEQVKVELPNRIFCRKNF